MRTMVAPPTGGAAHDLQPITLHLADMVLIASVDPGGERMTDILNRGGDLVVLPAGADPAAAESWLAVPINEIHLVVPPPHISPPEKRAEREKYPVRVRVDAWEVAGTAHLKPGAEQDALLQVTHPFLPLTDVTMTTGGGVVVENHEVVIVHLRDAEFVTDQE